jgi:hypothetical protein
MNLPIIVVFDETRETSMPYASNSHVAHVYGVTVHVSSRLIDRE